MKTAAGTAGFLAAMPCLNAAEVFTDTKPLKVGLVGCGGRGLGAMKNALDADPGTMVWALADVFQARVESIAVADSAALGGAMLAAHADGVPLDKMTAAFSPVTAVCLPRAANAAVYERLLPAIRELETAAPVA